MRPPELRLRAATPELIALPWDRPLAEWSVPEVALRDVPVGPSRHLVKFAEADGRLWALKELPPRIAQKEYAVLRRLEDMALPAVRPAGLVVQPGTGAAPAQRHRDADTAILVTHYLVGSWQYRRLFKRLPPDQPKHRARLLDAMAVLLVELHRHGVFWGDCSLANTLFSRDGQTLQAWLVDAETGEVHPTLTNGQRDHDLEILVENVGMGMIDLASGLDRPPELFGTLLAEAKGIGDRYTELWRLLHDEPEFGFGDRYRVEGTIRRLNELGYAVDEVALQPAGEGSGRLRLDIAVGDRRYHAYRLRELTGLDVGEGQATILLGDLFAYEAYVGRQERSDLPADEAANRWVSRVLRPGMARAHACVDHVGTPIQAYCDLLEVRWLLSERAGADVGDEAALAALARHRNVPTDSAAKMGVAETPTNAFRRVAPTERTSGTGGPEHLRDPDPIDDTGHMNDDSIGPPPLG